ncbi:MAG: CHAD domain-containing protein [Ignavibacteria bacterium]|nr:CHAD domain-containing protein [Ignavibacteria bacterium]
MIQPLEKVTPPADSSNKLHKVIVGSLVQRWRKHLAELKRCQKKCSEKAVHDLRVATRRLISTLDLIKTIHSDARLTKMRRELRKRLKMFGELRDVQVQALYVKKMLEPFPELNTFLTVLLLREQHLLDQIDKKLQKVQTGSMEKNVVETNNQLNILLSSSAMQSAGSAAVTGAAGAAFTRTVDLLHNVDPTDAKSIHKLRVAFKKFRYMVEALQQLLVGVTEKRLKAMHAYQTRLGDIQDIEVLTLNINGYAKRKKVPAASLERVQQELARRHTELINTFMNSADELFTFWGEEPAQLRIHSRKSEPLNESV